MSGRVKLIVAFGTGAVSGMVVVAGAVELLGREGWHVGGEALILPLFALLIYFGWSVGAEVDDLKRKIEREKAYSRGYREGVRVSCAEQLEAAERAEIKCPETTHEALTRHGIGY